MVAKCDQPQASPSGASPRPVRPTTITFRSFTPQPNGLEFKPGQDYYFITALHGHHQDPQKRFSPCRELNMRVTFRVCCKANNNSNSQAPNSGGSLGAILAGQQQQPSVAGNNKPGVNSNQMSPSLANPNGPQKGRPGSVMTVRPTFRPLNDYFSTLGATSGPQQPVTVLPIEVIQPPSDGSSSSSPPVNGEPQDPLGSSNDIKNGFQNGFQNEQPAHTGAELAPRLQPARQQQQPATGGPTLPRFSPPIFDIQAPPEALKHLDMTRWAPTPLPPHFVRPAPSGQSQNVKNTANNVFDRPVPSLQQPPMAILPNQRPSNWDLPPIGNYQTETRRQLPRFKDPSVTDSRQRFYPWPPSSKYPSQERTRRKTIPNEDMEL